ncbi:Membrane protein involved in the export of O-antigen and teichoic acid [Lachnospiraceae bacterium]|nr:Membrane protein involved in the export of O-antigen and teichoic acid [Lachnospiraceae bacterium]
MGKVKDETSVKALKAGVWYTFASFLKKGVAFATTPIFARLMTKGDYGSYGNFTVWLSICAVVCTLNLKSSVFKARYDYEDDFDGYLSSITFLGTLSTACFYAVVVIFQDFFVNLLKIDMIYLHVMFIELMFAPALDILQAKHRIMQEYKTQVALSIFESLACTFCSVGMVFICKDKLFARIIGGEVPDIIIYIVVFSILLFRGRKIISTEYWKYAAAYSIPVIPHLLSNIILGSSDKIMIRNMIGAEANGNYTLAYQCGMIVSTLMTSFNQAMTPWLYQKLHAEQEDAIKKVNRVYIISFVILVMAFILMAPEIVWVLGDKGYKGVEYIIPPIMLGYGFKFAYTGYVNVEQYHKKTGIVSVGTLIAATFNIVTNLIFLPIFGYAAAAYTTLAGFIMLLLLHYGISRKYGFTKIYDNRFTFLVMGAMMIIGLSLQFLYPFMLLRWALAFAFGMIALFEFYKLKKKYF